MSRSIQHARAMAALLLLTATSCLTGCEPYSAASAAKTPPQQDEAPEKSGGNWEAWRHH